MNNSNYQSVPVLASVIGSKTRKAMYLVNITSMDGEKVYKDKWVPVQWGQGVTIDWEYYSTSELVEFPLKNKSEIMIIEKHNASGKSNIVDRLVNGKSQSYYQMTDRFIVYIPTWLIKNFEIKYRKTSKVDKEKASELEQLTYHHNDDSPYSVMEDTVYMSEQAMELEYRPSAQRMLSGLEYENDALAQWEIDNPEYAMDSNLL